MTIATATADIDEMSAYVTNALGSIAEARSTVIDLLTSPNDIYVKVSIVSDLDAAEHNLRKALS